MKGTKIIKAYCKKSRQYFGLEIKKDGSKWVVVDFTYLPQEQAELIYSEVKQDKFTTAANLLPCRKCGSRVVGGCACSPKRHACSHGMGYQFDCVYCNNMVIDYSLPSASAVKGMAGKSITLAQGKEFKVVTFSNVTWTKFDNISNHPSGAMFHEPKVHVAANQDNIEFHGYNVSAMDEGVYYSIGQQDDFVIECNVDTSTIKPHPGGNMYISLGIITANLTQTGGKFFIDKRNVANVGAKFRMKLSLIGGRYEVEIDGKKCGSEDRQSRGEIRIVFGFKHDSHYCELLSHAYVKGIKMNQAISHQ